MNAMVAYEWQLLQEYTYPDDLRQPPEIYW
jgi:hypothetical protein